MSSNTLPDTKQKFLTVSGLLSGAVTWGLIWYPYRLLQNMGVSGEFSTFVTYFLPLILGALLFSAELRHIRHFPPILLWISLAAGWTNLAYVESIIHGEVMRVLLLFYLSPLWTVILARWLLDERLNAHGYAVMLVSLSGAAVMLWQPSLGMPLPRNGAEWLGLSAGMMFAVTNVLSRKAEDLSVAHKSLAVWAGVSVLAAGAVYFQPAGMPDLATLAAQGWMLLLMIGIIIFGVTLAVQYGLARAPANQAIVLFLFELVVAAISAYLLAGEVMGPQEWIGGALIVAATLFSGKMENRRAG